MGKIKQVVGREILDSRGYPTIEVDITLESGHKGRMMVPSGASTGKFEAWELRDQDPSRFRGKGVSKAVAHVNHEIAKAVTGLDAADHERIDRTLIELDGTKNKSRLGANAILGVSFAAAHAEASERGLPLYQYLADRFGDLNAQPSLPLPMVNIISGGLHAGKNIDIQDFLIMPVGAKSYPEALQMISDVYFKTQEILAAKGYQSRLLADEGGFGPHLTSNEEALDILCESVQSAGYKRKDEVAFALDVASSHFYDESSGTYRLGADKQELTSEQMIEKLENWVEKYPILSIEDGLAEEDWAGWTRLTERLGDKVQLVGDDLFTTNPQRIQKGIALKAGNAVLVKMNQIGSLTETVTAVKLAKEAGLLTVISARSGETEDCTLADLAVGLNGGQIKIGSIAGSSRTAKYNQLWRIHHELNGRFTGKRAFHGRFHQ
ncbi:phosphopyruvate hydratase [Paenibacillus sp. oral taxon 786 str. D14]|uniref:phosphopyruvate hydratase n=1 Tax=Paenibacillus sp. oral taxon 786 TaxID=652715 RepID=UPI0001AFDCFB|nr:phosphopyruvate hydratase [Paenibacillus sp. oral taxon 786]EES72363.1 phosphopyruvate hydratase [Paenibacillus sp. oral taxon 786 str. D14]